MKRRFHPDLLFFLGLCLAVTLATGFFLRLHLGAWMGLLLQGLDLHRAHSHLAYYGVLFPMVWVALRPSGAWIPGKTGVFLYFAACLVSYLGFLREGYGKPAIAGSTWVLGVWLFFAWKNRKRWRAGRDGWLAAVPAAVAIAAATIPFVAVRTNSDPAFAKAAANFFLALLMFGVFIPAILSRALARLPNAWVWFTLSLAAAIDTSGFELGAITGLGCFAWGAGFTVFLIRSERRRLAEDPVPLAWLLVALSMAAIGVGLVPRHHEVSVAGIHFIALGPLLIGFLRDHLGWRLSRPFLLLYPAALFLMLGAILLTRYGGPWIVEFQRLAGLAGGALILALTLETRARLRKS